jgi:YqaJ-like viral recombinase domain
MKLHRVEQGSAEWYRLRLGIPTSSNFHKIVTPAGAPSKQAVKYLYRLVAERLLNETMDDEIGYVKWVAAGKDNEPYAVKQFEFVNEVELLPGGFVTSDDGRIGASPDRIFKGHRESLEIKSPAPWTQLQYLLEGPEDAYIAQTQGHLLVGDGFEAVHFYTYNPRTPPFHKIILRDRGFQAILASALSSFCDVLDRTTERARALGAYSVVRRVETPGEIAYQADEDMQLRLINPEEGDLGDAPA